MSERLGFGLLWAGALIGCGLNNDPAGTPGEPLGSVVRALGEDTCGTALATAVIGNGTSFRSPDVYGTEGCSDAVVVDVAPFAFFGTASVLDVGSAPSDQISCENTTLSVDFYAIIQDPSSSEAFVDFGLETARARFIEPDTCELPRVDFALNPRVLGLNRDEIESMTALRVAAGAAAEQGADAGPVQRPVEISYLDP